MNNISFSNPYLLLLLIPFLLVCIVPYCFAVRRDNKTINHRLSLIVHIAITILVTFVIAGFTYELVVTETNIYVVADLSYSSSDNVDKIDEYINRLDNNKPKNSKIGVVAFAKNQVVLNNPGEKIVSVREAKDKIDMSETNINEALSFTAQLFKNDVLKRIVLISDGKETNKTNMVSLVESLQSNDIYIDAIYLDNNLKETTKEIQITDVSYNPNTFINKEESLDILIESNHDARGSLRLVSNGFTYDQACKLNKGLTVVKMPLSTKTSGIFDYTLELDFDKKEDTSSFNNTYLFTQSVSSEVNVLFIGDTYLDEAAFNKLYKDNASDAKFKCTTYFGLTNVPYTVEDLSKFDEIVLSNVDIRTLNNSKQFLKSLDTVVSEFGKRLLTIGNTFIQDDKDGTLKDYSRMLPVSYGNNDTGDKSVCIILDISKSLSELNKEKIAKEAASTILDLLKATDEVAVVGVYGDIINITEMQSITDIEALKKEIKAAKLGQGTSLGAGLKRAFDILAPRANKKKEAFLISDGINGKGEGDLDEITVAKMRENNIILNTINANSDDDKGYLVDLATKGNGNSYIIREPEDTKNIILTEVADDLQETEIKGSSYEVKINRNDAVLDNVYNVSNINGFYYNESKNHTRSILKTSYTKNGITKEVDLFTTWRYGNGEVESLSTRLENDWTLAWNNDDTNAFLGNLKNRLIPDIKVDSPFTFNIEVDGAYLNLKIKAPSISIGDELNLIITTPDGKDNSVNLAFDSQYYITRFKISDIGKYNFKLSYQNGDISYSANKEYSISYLQEYDKFVKYDASNMYHMVSQNCQVSEDGNLEIKIDSDYVESYLYDFTIVFMIICAFLFVLDICVRKLRLEDLKSFFKIKRGK